MQYTEQYTDELNEKIFIECMALREKGHKVGGTYCAFTPKEILAAGGVVPVSLCAGSYETAKKAEIHLPRNMCDLIKSSYGHGISDSCPYFHFSDFIVADATCDGKKKMFELLGEHKETHVLDLPQSYNTEKSQAYFKQELQKVVDYVEARVGEPITKQKLNQSIEAYNRLNEAKLKLYELNHHEIPLVSGKEMNCIINGISFECHLDRRVQELETVLKDLESRRLDSSYIDGVKGKHRILLTGCPVTNTKLLDIIESKNAVVVASESCGGLKTAYDRTAEWTDDPLQALVESYLSVACPCMTPNPKRYEIIKEIVSRFKIDAVIELTWIGCHTYNVEARSIKSFVSGELGTPYLQIDTDYSSGDTGQIEVRVEALLESL